MVMNAVHNYDVHLEEGLPSARVQDHVGKEIFTISIGLLGLIPVKPSSI